MAITRRKFLKTGTLVALAAGIPLKAALLTPAQQVRKPNQEDNPIERTPQNLTPDPLANYSKASFSPYVNSVFRLNAGRLTVDVTLLEVKDIMSKGAVAQGGAECFSLLFRGGSNALPQNTYRLDHPSLGSFQMFLVPSGADDNGAQGYVAIVNRLAYASFVTPPSRVSPGTSTLTPANPKKPNVPSTTVTPTPRTVTPPAASPQTAAPTKTKPPVKKGLQQKRRMLGDPLN